MPDLDAALGAWLAGAGDADLGIPTTMAEFVERAGGKAAAARELGINPRTGRAYTVRTVERYLHARGDINPRTGREYEARTMSGAVRAAFDAARASMVAGARVRLDDVYITVSDETWYYAHGAPAGGGYEAVDADTMARVVSALRRGDAADAAREFEHAFLESYGIPGAGDAEGHEWRRAIGDVGLLTILRA